MTQADPRWYETALDGPEGRRTISWRDPKPLKVGDTYYATVDAREVGGPTLRCGCAGLMTSTDMEHWEVQPPLFAPRRYWDLECPQPFAVDGAFYLTAAIMEDRTQRYWAADAITGPYRTPPDGGVLVPQGHYAGRVCRWRGEDLYFCWHKADYDFPGVRNPAGKFVVVPLALVPRPDGSLAARTFSGWRTYSDGDATAPVAASRSLYGDRDTGDDATFRVEAPDGANDTVATAEDAEHFLLQGVLHLDAVSGGIGFRLDTEGGGYFVEVTTGGTEVKLLKWLPTPREGRPYFTYTVLQRGHLRAPAAPDAPLPFALLVVGAYIEVTLGDAVVLCTLSAERTRGPVGLWAQSGTAHAEELRLTPMRVPQHG